MMGRKKHPAQQHLSVWKLQTKGTEPTTEQSCKNKNTKRMERNSLSVKSKLWEKNNKDESSRREYI
jgi:hypothetical protein